VDAAGRAGLLQHRSHQVVPIDRCRIAHPAIQRLDLLSRSWLDTGAFEVDGLDADASGVAASGVAASDVAASDVAAADVAASDVAAPDVAASGVGALDVAASDVAASDVAAPGVGALDAAALDAVALDAVALEAVATSAGDVAAFARPVGTGLLPTDDPTEAAASDSGRRVHLSGPTSEVVEEAVGRRWHIAPESFWQIHPAAADTLAATVVDLLRPAPGEVSWDLYGGAGLFAAAVTARTGARTSLVESSPLGCAAARSNLTDLPTIEVVEARVETALHRRRLTAPVDLVVLDPPRSGAGARVVRAIAAARPRAVAYVACDPASLARDVATFRSLGWELTTLRAFDCFPMTQHVECVALLEPAAEEH
jgi:hypothetical protein